MDMGIPDVWRIVKRRIPFIAILTIIALSITGWISFVVLNPEYEATAKLLVQSQNTDNQAAYSDLETNQQLITTYGEIIKSNRIAEDVITTLNLNLSLKELLDKVRVHATEDSLVTSVTVTHNDPTQAVAIANGFAQSFYENLGAIMKVDNVSILDEAKLPEDLLPVRPKPYLNMSVAFVLSLISGVCLALMWELFDRTVKTEETIEELLGLPVLGVVIHYKGKKKQQRGIRYQREQRGETHIENESGNTQAILP